MLLKLVIPSKRGPLCGKREERDPGNAGSVNTDARHSLVSAVIILRVKQSHGTVSPSPEG